MWNYVDLIILVLFFMMFVLRCVTLSEADAHQSRLLQLVNFLFGISTLLLTLRFSSILEVNKTVGPLQLALFRMCIDLLIILTQFSFVIMAFSAAITKVYIAEISFWTPPHRKESNETSQIKEFSGSGQIGGSVERISTVGEVFNSMYQVDLGDAFSIHESSPFCFCSFSEKSSGSK